jgi:asparagine synthetase A
MTASIAVSNGKSVSETPAKKVVVIKSISQWYSHAVKRLGKNQATEFLTETRAFLCEEETREITRPLLNLWDWNQITAEECVKVLFQDLVKWQAERAMKKAIEGTSKKNWSVVIKSGENIVHEGNFDDANTAERWSWRRLVESESNAIATITAKTEKTILEVDRHTAIWKLREIVKHPFMKVTSSGSGGLGWGHKARDFKPRFSHG